MKSNKRVICLMGPTTAGKTSIGIKLAEQYPIDIISVDSAMIYRGMDIGTDKPSKVELQKIPHNLIDILNPTQKYSVSKFYLDASLLIKSSLDIGRIPMLIGGCMMYFNVLQNGLFYLPKAKESIRNAIEKKSSLHSWEIMHKELSIIDPISALKIHPNDSQRIQRALEVISVVGKPIHKSFENINNSLNKWDFVKIVISPSSKENINRDIEKRFYKMLKKGFIGEVESLYDRSDLSKNMPSMRAIGYRQAWSYLDGQYSLDVMIKNSIIATKQLAKRQFTWLRSWNNTIWIDSKDFKLYEKIMLILK